MEKNKQTAEEALPKLYTEDQENVMYNIHFESNFKVRYFSTTSDLCNDPTISLATQVRTYGRKHILYWFSSFSQWMCLSFDYHLVIQINDINC